MKKTFYSVTQFEHGRTMPCIFWFDSKSAATEYHETHDFSEAPVTHHLKEEESIHSIESIVKNGGKDGLQQCAIGPYYNRYASS